MEPECDRSSATTYFWYRQTLNTTSTIAESGGLNVKMTLSLLVAWVIVCLAVIKGIASSGKVAEGAGTTGPLVICYYSRSPFFPAGDVLQLSVSLRGAPLFPGQGFDAEGVGGRNRTHVHSQGDAGS